MLRKIKKNVYLLSISSAILTALFLSCGFLYFFHEKPLDIVHMLFVSLPILLVVVMGECVLLHHVLGQMAQEHATMNERVEEQKQKQKEVDKIKRQFTANVSHELKTPLTSIAGYAELISSGIAKEEDVKKFAGTIHSEAQRLISLSGDIIKLSQLDESEGAPQHTKVDLYECAQTCVNALALRAEKRGVLLRLQGESCIINANLGLIEDMIYNLCENAIRYNKEGGSVTISVGFNGNSSLLRVADTGIGIPVKHQKRVFERFYRVDKSRSKETGGTGLGLAIVKHIAEFHGASLTLESKENEGTIITIRFRE